MIISHKYRFIFIRTEKTAGTSLQLALSKFCGPDDVITPNINKVDQQKITELGYPAAQNYSVPFWQHGWRDLFRVTMGGKRMSFNAHSSALEIRQLLPAHVWDGYFKFSFERNPWDKMISLYYWRLRKSNDPMSMDEFLESKYSKVRASDRYLIDEKVEVDYLANYENLEAELAFLTERLGLPEPLKMPSYRAKGQYRKDKRHYREVLTTQQADLIAKRFSREIELMGYTY